MILPKRIYYTGAPGSRWSGIAQDIESLPGMNTSDRTLPRNYTHGEFSGHKGAYFGPGMEFEAIPKDTDKAWIRPDDGCMLVKSHHWAYMLDSLYVYQTCKEGNWIMLVYRPDMPCYAWWHQAGGFNIGYPDYSWYENSEQMLIEIQKQNKMILEFGAKHNCRWSYFNSEWIKRTFDEDVDIDPVQPDVLVTMIKG